MRFHENYGSQASNGSMEKKSQLYFGPNFGNTVSILPKNCNGNADTRRVGVKSKSSLPLAPVSSQTRRLQSPTPCQRPHPLPSLLFAVICFRWFFPCFSLFIPPFRRRGVGADVRTQVERRDSIVPPAHGVSLFSYAPSVKPSRAAGPPTKSAEPAWKRVIAAGDSKQSCTPPPPPLSCHSIFQRLPRWTKVSGGNRIS